MTFEQFNSNSASKQTEDPSARMMQEVMVATHPRDQGGGTSIDPKIQNRNEFNPSNQNRNEFNPSNQNSNEFNPSNQNRNEFNPSNQVRNTNNLETTSSARGTGVGIGRGGDGGNGGNAAIQDNSQFKDNSIFYAPNRESTKGIPPGTEGAHLQVSLPTGEIDYHIYGSQSSSAFNFGIGAVIPGAGGGDLQIGTASTGSAPVEVRQAVTNADERAGKALDHILSNDHR